MIQVTLHARNTFPRHPLEGFFLVADATFWPLSFFANSIGDEFLISSDFWVHRPHGPIQASRPMGTSRPVLVLSGIPQHPHIFQTTELKRPIYYTLIFGEPHACISMIINQNCIHMTAKWA